MRVPGVKLPAVHMTERDLARAVADTAKHFGWLRYHTHRSDFSPAGFPDETLVREDRLVFAELKGGRKGPSPAQQQWLAALAQIPGIEVYVWRPEHWPDEIVRVLR